MVRAWLEARAQMGMLPRGFQPQRQHEMAMMVGQLGSGRAVPAGTTAMPGGMEIDQGERPGRLIEPFDHGGRVQPGIAPGLSWPQRRPGAHWPQRCSSSASRPVAVFEIGR